MAGMQQIEAAVGEADAQPLPVPFVEPLVEHRPVEHDLVLVRERRRRQHAGTQFGRRHGRGAALADHHGGSRIGDVHGVGELHTGRHHRGQHRHHGIAGTGHVAHLDRMGGDGNQLSSARSGVLHQRHALLAARHQHGAAAHDAIEFGDRRRDLGRAGDRAPGDFGEFLAVRRDQRGVGVIRKVLALGIDDHRLAGLARRLDHGADDARGQHAFGVVGEHDRPNPRQRLEHRIDDRLLDLAGNRLCQLPVGAQQVGGMMLGDEADLAGGRTRPVDDEMGLDRRLGAERRLEGASGLVVSPITLTKMQRAPSAAMLRATLPAPPTTSSLLLTARTCTGASGEMRVTSP